MKNVLFLISMYGVFAITACAQSKKTISAIAPVDVAIAFPGAEGYGKYTTGGGGGKIFIVSNLNDKGPGSFREAAETKGKRKIIFEVSNTSTTHCYRIDFWLSINSSNKARMLSSENTFCPCNWRCFTKFSCIRAVNTF